MHQPTHTALRTPDARFDDLLDYPYAARYVDDLPGYAGLRAAYVDEGPSDAGHTYLCLHGEPTWGYLYRKLVPTFVASGARVVVPDLFGFGRSDKPVRDDTYGFRFHRDFLLRLVERLDLRRVTLVAQDWGATLGLTLPVDRGFRARLGGLFVMNTVLPTGESLGEHYEQWRALVRSMPELPVGRLMAEAAPGLTAGERAAYDAPYPDARYQAGARRFPELAMVTTDMPGVAEARDALTFWRDTWDGPSFMAIGGQDPQADAMPDLHRQIRGCPPPLVVPEAGHFVPEHGATLATAALRSLGRA